MSNPAPFEQLRTWETTLLSVLRVVRTLCQILGFPIVLFAFGYESPPVLNEQTFALLLVIVVSLLTLIPLVRWYLLDQSISQVGLTLLVSLITIGGTAIFWVLGNDPQLYFWWYLAVLIHVLIGLLSLFRRVYFSGWSPAVIFVLSFLSLIFVGTALRLLPGKVTTPHEALFTATSAVCVTGLTIKDTGTEWSREGQIIILFLIQLGGLGLMTSGAAFALLVRRGLQLRERRVLSDLYERGTLHDLRRLVMVIIFFTLAVEAVGALLLSGLWSEKPLTEQIFYSAFHSVSAFCNAGFSLQPRSMSQYHTTWQVLGVMPALVILGGLGFVVIYDIGQSVRFRWKPSEYSLFHEKGQRIRLSLTTKIVLWSTLFLLVVGTVGIFILELRNESYQGTGERIQGAWFHSMSSRTAGFNTQPIGSMSASTLFFILLLMGIGASPGSTGGGIKTVPIVISLLTLRALMRGREKVEVSYRTVPPRIVYRALTIVVLGLLTMVLLTLIVVSIENRPDLFLKHMFEVGSALATVGLSAVGTSSLQQESQMVLIVAMFIGRVGPLTLILSVAGNEKAVGAYSYPEERVLLG